MNDFTKPIALDYFINDIRTGRAHLILPSKPTKFQMICMILGSTQCQTGRRCFEKNLRRKKAEDSARSRTWNRDALDILAGALETCDFWDSAKVGDFMWFPPWGYLLQTVKFPKKCSLKIVDKSVEVRYSCRPQPILKVVRWHLPACKGDASRSTTYR